MVQKERQRTLIPNLSDGRSLDVSAVNAGVTLKSGNRQIVTKRFELTTAFVISMLAANDFGAQKLCDLPTTNLLFLGAVIDFTAVVAGLTTNTGASIDVALGTVTTASAAFSNAGEQNLVQKIDGTGAGTTATVKGASGTEGTPVNALLLAAGAKSVFLNASSPVTSGTGTITAATGYVEIMYIDLGDHA